MITNYAQNTINQYQKTSESKSKILYFPTAPEANIKNRASKPIKSKSKPTMAVQPLKTEEDVQAAKAYFLNKPERYENQNIRDYAIFVCGINIARRGGDLLKLKVSDVLNEDSSLKNHITIKEQKTGKISTMKMVPVIEDALLIYLSTLDDLNLNDPLFPSRKKDKHGNKKPMTIQNYYYKMQGLKAELKLECPIGTHTMRKTWGYHALRNNKDDSNILANISKVYNHSNIETTFRYLGIEQEEIDATFLNNQL